MPEFVPSKTTGKKSSENNVQPAAPVPPAIVPDPVMATASVKCVDEPMRGEPSAKADVSSVQTSSEPGFSKTRDFGSPKVSENPKKEKSPDAETRKKKKTENRSLTDKEFWTILLTPDFDSKAFSAFRKLLGGMLRLFRIRFKDCYVDGIRMRYDHMGYGASVNGFLKSFPWVGDWDFRMDWTMDHELQSAGEIVGKINLCRVLGFAILLLFHGSVLGISFWRRRRHVLRTNELPELSWLRNKIVGWMVE